MSSVQLRYVGPPNIIKVDGHALENGATKEYSKVDALSMLEHYPELLKHVSGDLEEEPTMEVEPEAILFADETSNESEEE